MFKSFFGDFLGRSIYNNLNLTLMEEEGSSVRAIF